jgi:hypothetical protein
MSALADRTETQLAAELALASELHGLILHEVGNPLQSLAVLVELTHDDLQTPAVSPEACAGRLEKALGSIDRLRDTLRSLSRARICLSDPDGTKVPTWGEFLDHLTPLIEARLARSRATLERRTQGLDARALPPGSHRAGCLRLMLDACDQIRESRLREPILSLEASERGLCLTLRDREGPVSFSEASLSRLTSLVNEGWHADGPRVVIG